MDEIEGLNLATDILTKFWTMKLVVFALLEPFGLMMADSDQSAAALRRERRRQKILAGSEDRMKKITGHGNIQEPTYTDLDDHQHGETSITGSSEDLVRPNCTQPLVLDGTGRRMSEMSTESNSQLRNTTTATPIATREEDQQLSDSVNNHHAPRQPPVGVQDKELAPAPPPVDGKKSSEVDTFADSFMKIRTVLMLVVGILVRLSFEHSFGQEYVQSIVNPFTALEIAIIGYQKAIGMDLGVNVKGGIWLSTLVLAGIKTEIIYTYKNVMGVITAAASDFAVFFFGFVALHLVL